MNKYLSSAKKIGFRKICSLIWYYIWGHILGAIFYRRKYYYGKWFKGKLGGIAAPGWKWICIDVLGHKFFPKVPWPCSPYISCGKYQNIHFHPDDINNFQGIGNNFQTWTDGHIFIGYGTYIAMNVGIITTNHDMYDPNKHLSPKDVHLGEHCWIGMNSMILPGVTLGDHTVVGAGSVVTKSFLDGYCVIAGNPAKKIRDLDKNQFCEESTF